MRNLFLSVIATLTIAVVISSCGGFNPLSPKPTDTSTNASTNATNSTNASTNSTNSTNATNSTNTNGLVLWNKLGSISEVTTSSFGTNMSIVGTPTYAAGVFGNGVRVTANNHLEIPSSCLLSNKGTVEMWVTPDVGFSSAQRFLFEVVNNVGASIGTYFYYDSSFSAGQKFCFVASPNNCYGPEAGVTNAGVAVHVAAVWDFSGIGGGPNTIRIYTNGVAAISVSPTTPMTFKPNGTMRLGVSWDNTRAYLGVIDNLKIWNYAKTNFSDRFTE